MQCLSQTLFPFSTRYIPRENITFNPNQTVSFLLPQGAIFEPSMSVGPEEDKVTSLNLAVAVSECHPTVRWFLSWLSSTVNRYLRLWSKAKTSYAKSSCVATVVGCFGLQPLILVVVPNLFGLWPSVTGCLWAVSLTTVISPYSFEWFCIGLKTVQYLEIREIIEYFLQ